jgi:BASS family bile acid:Na+ symporter
MINSLLLPMALGVIMFGLGLSLTIADFTRVVRFPKAVLIGLFIQTGVMPVVCLGIVTALRLPAELAVGLMLLAAAPGGATANIYSHLARGDVALNITLTAINSALSLLTLPIVVSLSLWFFMGQEAYVPPPFRKILEVGIIILGPVAVGMGIRAWAGGFARRMEKPMRVFSVLLLTALVVVAVVQEWDNLTRYFAVVGLACLLFNLISMGAGYAVPRLLRIPDRQAIAIAMEIGIHNGTLAIYIAFNVLGAGVMSIPAAVYSLIMFVTAALFVWRLNRRTTGVIP